MQRGDPLLAILQRYGMTINQIVQTN
ncbi:hypothetical protein ACF5W4_04370 [Bacillota bacterium Lsc_1132]